MVNVVEVVVRTVNDTRKGLEAAKSDFSRAWQDIAGSLKPIGLALGGSGLLSMATPLAAAGAAVGAFGLVAVSAYSKANKALKSLQAAEKAYNSATTPAAKAAALKRVQDAQAGLSGSQEQLLQQEEKFKGLWNETVNAMTPVVVVVSKVAIALMQDLMPAFKTLATAGGAALSSVLGAIDKLVQSSGFSKFIQDVASFARQAAPVIGTMLVGALQLLMQLMEQLMPIGLQLLKAFTPLFLGVLKSAVPIVKGLAVVLLAVLQPLSKYPNIIGPLVVAFYGLLKVLQLVRGVFLLVTAVMEINPVIAITTAIIALAVGFGIAWKSSATFRDIVKDIAKVMLAVGIVILEANKAIVNAFLWMAGTVIHAAATAFGWIPGLGPKIRTAATVFDNFRAGVNNDFDAMINKLHQWQGELDASKNKSNTTTQIIKGNYGQQLLSTNAATKGVNLLALAIAQLHSKNVNIGMNGKGQFTIAQVNQITGNTAPGVQKAAGGLITGGVAGRDSVVASLMPGEVVVPTHMVNAGAVDHLRGSLPGFGAGGLVGNLSGGYVTGMYGSFQNRMTSAMVAAMRAALAHAEAAAAKAAAAASSSVGNGGPVGGDAAANKALARKMFPWPASQWGAFDTLEMHEAGYNRFARNPGSGAYGIPQALPPTKMPFAAQAAGGSHAGPQLSWMFNYIRATYGTPGNAWAKYYQHPGGVGWYGAGGATSAGWAMVGEHGRELVKVPGGATVYPHGTSAGMVAGGAAGAALVQLEISGGGQSQVEQFLLYMMRNLVRVKGGGSVQKAFGYGPG